MVPKIRSKKMLEHIDFWFSEELKLSITYAIKRADRDECMSQYYQGKCQAYAELMGLDAADMIEALTGECEGRFD